MSEEQKVNIQRKTSVLHYWYAFFNTSICKTYRAVTHAVRGSEYILFYDFITGMSDTRSTSWFFMASASVSLMEPNTS